MITMTKLNIVLLNLDIVFFLEIAIQKHSMLLTDHPMKLMKRSNLKKNRRSFQLIAFSRPLIMGCYGIGLTRLMAATVEILTTNQSNNIRWPRRIVPYQVAILPPKVSDIFI